MGRLTGQSSDKARPSPTSGDSFALTGPSTHPDPTTHAYRKDLADIALVGQVLASHYAEPVSRAVAGAAFLKAQPSESAENVRPLAAGETFQLLEDSVGWAWGYAASDHRVGYVASAALSRIS